MIKKSETGWAVKTVGIVIPLFIVFAGVALAFFLYVTKPSAKRGERGAEAPLVEVMEAVSSNHVVTISSMGVVMASRTIALKPRVGGFVLETSDRFVPGGIFKKGEVILKLDPRDFELALKKKEAILLRAQAELSLESGRQDVARAEVKLMETTSGKRLGEAGLALREPQLAQVRADLASVKVDVETARIDLERTVIRAPFNCMVMEKNVEQGSQVSIQESLATLAGTDEYWVEATLPMDELGWIKFSLSGQGGSPVTLLTRDGKLHHGKVYRLLGDLSSKSRLARVLISIKDPLGLVSPKSPPLLINSYVTVAIQGERLDNVIALPRRAAREGDGVWIARNNELSIGQLEILWKNSETLFVKSGVEPGDEVVLSELSSALDGMAIRVKER